MDYKKCNKKLINISNISNWSSVKSLTKINFIFFISWNISTTRHWVNADPIDFVLAKKKPRCHNVNVVDARFILQVKCKSQANLLTAQSENMKKTFSPYRHLRKVKTGLKGAPSPRSKQACGCSWNYELHQVTARERPQSVSTEDAHKLVRVHNSMYSRRPALLMMIVPGHLTHTD